MISATVVCDSISTGGLRVTTLELVFPVFMFEAVTRDSLLSHSSPMLGFGDISTTSKGYKPLLATSGHWPSILDSWTAVQTGEMDKLRFAVSHAIKRSVPNKRDPGDWHLPYLDEVDSVAALSLVIGYCMRSGMDLANVEGLAWTAVIRASAVRCSRMRGPIDSIARVEDLDQELDLFSSLTGDTHRRFEYLEHQLAVDFSDDQRWLNTHLHGQSAGWIQHRKLFQREWKPTGYNGGRTDG